jgi:hypothetical protein
MENMRILQILKIKLKAPWNRYSRGLLFCIVWTMALSTIYIFDLARSVVIPRVS